MQLSEIKNLLETRPNQWAVQQARVQQSKIRFHSDIILNRTEAGIAYFEFISWVGRLLKQDKFNRFNELMQFPNPNNELVDAIHSELSKALSSEDRVEKYLFDDDKAKADWSVYKAQFGKFWNTRGWEAYKKSINSFIIIDMPDEQLGRYPEASYFLLDIDNVIDAKVDKDNVCHYIIFETDKGKAVYCDEFMRLFDADDNLISEVEHELGECPARNFWTSTINSKSNINKQGSISGELSELNWLLFERVNKKYADMGNAYPIIYEYESDEDDSDDDKPTSQEGDTKNQGADLVGAGSHKELPMPTNKDEHDPMSKPIHTEKVDVAGLDYNTREEERLKKNIFNASVGFGGESTNDTAKNEKQIQSGFESRESTLVNIAANFASAESWANGMVCRIRYEDSYISNFIYGGSKFFLRSEADISEQLKTTESDVIKESLNEQMIEMRFKKDDNQKLRAKILIDIDPFAYRSNTEIISLFEKGLISNEDFQLKNKMFTFVKRFERENLPITEFEADKPYNARIENIIKIIKSYVDTSKQIEEPQD
jgi:hypothetical protein